MEKKTTKRALNVPNYVFLNQTKQIKSNTKILNYKGIKLMIILMTILSLFFLLSVLILIYKKEEKILIQASSMPSKIIYKNNKLNNEIYMQYTPDNLHNAIIGNKNTLKHIKIKKDNAAALVKSLAEQAKLRNKLEPIEQSYVNHPYNNKPKIKYYREKNLTLIINNSYSKIQENHTNKDYKIRIALCDSDEQTNLIKADIISKNPVFFNKQQFFIERIVYEDTKSVICYLCMGPYKKYTHANKVAKQIEKAGYTCFINKN